MYIFKTIALLIISIIITLAVIFCESVRSYVIIGSIVCVALYSIVRNPSEFKKFFKETWYAFAFLLLAFSYGIFKGSERFWHDFEASSILLMILYSFVIFIKLLADKKVNKNAVLTALPLLSCGIILLLLSVWASIGEGIDIESGNGFKLHISGARGTTMGFLVFGATFYAIVNFFLSRGESAYKDVYIKSLQYSDIPVTITFLLLWASTHFIECSDSLQYDAFYGGVIAFQMLYSNIIWSFIDHPIFEKILI